eukprot:TRINITY_DN9309_c0_g1_i1.p1 TRINITY_DN9309_c0_g1~~TRINITY_DN9309_c0_g1_i1.p1  ORF type:complete len:252 (+),score=47.00 TRINITY_DN9309_c0_g1_i1:70-825(+)
MDADAKQDGVDRKDHDEDLKARNAAAVSEATQGRIEPVTPRYARIFASRENILCVGADVVVNAANEGLMGGGGVDGVLHSQAFDPQPVTDIRNNTAQPSKPHDSEACPLCREIRDNIPIKQGGGGVVRLWCGEATVTHAYNIPHTRYIVHTVGPYLHETTNKPQPHLLASCYHECLAAASRLKPPVKSIAFPSISTGYYGYPMLDAARVAIETITHYFSSHNSSHTPPWEPDVYLLAFGETNAVLFEALLK